VLRTGTQAAYRSVVELSGEPHVVRADLTGETRTGTVAPQGEVIACIAHITDLHVTDAQSPGRFEFLNREWSDPRFRELLTMQRPQEMLNTHAVAAMVRAINGVESGPLTRTPVRVVAMTGDAIDNTQHNELTNAIALLDGGTVRPDSGAAGYEGVQRVEWESEIFWKPDGPPELDRFQSAFGFPRRPGLLEQAIRPFQSDGLKVPWLRCHGNHEYVCQGVGLVTPALAEAMTGSRKTVGLPRAIDPEHAVEAFVAHPELFLSGADVEVSRDPDRRPIAREEFMPEPYCVRDVGAVRFITLDTVCLAGGADGAVDSSQLRWLERTLEGARDHQVVLLSHHSSDRLANPRGEQNGAALLELLSRSPNVVLWLNGHIHANRITPHDGFWEVTTASIVDWPSQVRLVEIFGTADGRLAVGCTMLDHDGAGFAGLHRELAGNARMYYGFDSGSAGTQLDRNAILLLPAQA
jgi:3',5'-cyclic AMP phosphodiesterase CpdA